METSHPKEYVLIISKQDFLGPLSHRWKIHLLDKFFHLQYTGMQQPTPRLDSMKCLGSNTLIADEMYTRLTAIFLHL